VNIRIKKALENGKGAGLCRFRRVVSYGKA
jgi:hypothetical protein